VIGTGLGRGAHRRRSARWSWFPADCRRAAPNGAICADHIVGWRPTLPMTGYWYGVLTDRLPGAGGVGREGRVCCAGLRRCGVVLLEVWREMVTSGCRW